MEFEEKLNEMYQEIANHINGMIPIEWEQVYTIAYINDEGGEVSLIILYLVEMTYITILLFLKTVMFQKNI